MTASSFSNFFNHHFVALWALTAFLWMKGGKTRLRDRDSFMTLSWVVIGVIVAAMDVVWGVRTKQWGGFILGIAVLVFGINEIRSMLAQKRIDGASSDL